jgi:hypothetical protein
MQRPKCLSTKITPAKSLFLRDSSTNSATYEQPRLVMKADNMISKPTAAQTKYWEDKLKTYRLGEERAERPEMDMDGVRADRVVQLDKNPDTIVVGPIVLPQDADVAEVFAMDSLGVSYPKAPTRFWPFAGAINRSAYVKTHRMGLKYGQEMPGDPEKVVPNV